MGDAVGAKEHLPTSLRVGVTVELTAGGSSGGRWEKQKKGDNDTRKDEVEMADWEEGHVRSNQ